MFNSVKFTGGREGKQTNAVACIVMKPLEIVAVFVVLVVGTLKGYDQLVNIVLDDTVEYLRGNDVNVSNGQCQL
jgi:small nuclear ribonucleoprotein (snRNP)-like protein